MEEKLKNDISQVPEFEEKGEIFVNEEFDLTKHTDLKKTEIEFLIAKS